MTIHGGAWNRKMKFIEDIPSHQRSLAAPFPVVHLQIIETSESQLYQHANTSFGSISKFLQEKLTKTEALKKHHDHNEVELKAEIAAGPKPVDLNSDISQMLDVYDFKNNKYYLAPLYITGSRGMLPSETAVAGFVRHIPVRIDNVTTAGFWVKRNVALLLHKAWEIEWISLIL